MASQKSTGKSTSAASPGGGRCPRATHPVPRDDPRADDMPLATYRDQTVTTPGRFVTLDELLDYVMNVIDCGADPREAAVIIWDGFRLAGFVTGLRKGRRKFTPWGGPAK